MTDEQQPDRQRAADMASPAGASGTEEPRVAVQAAGTSSDQPAADDGRTARQPEAAEPLGRSETAEPSGRSRGGEQPEAGEPAASASPESVKRGHDAAPVSSGEAARVPEKERTTAPWRRLSSAGALIWVLLALFGFTLVVQLRSNNTEDGLASARQEDLVRILSDLEARDTRLQAEITALETSQRQLTSGVAGREAALAEADKRATELGLLAGTLRGRGPGLVVSIGGVKASAVLNAVQELRGAGGEVMQIAGSAGGAVRIVASTYFVDSAGGAIMADGVRLTEPYTLTVIGQPQTMETALRIPGGVVASVGSDGGSVTMEQRTSVDVTAVRQARSLQYARPVS